MRQGQKEEETASAFLPLLPLSLTHNAPLSLWPPVPLGPGLSWVEAAARELLSSPHLPPVWLWGVSLAGRLGVASRAARLWGGVQASQGASGWR